jgi:hypothetical protein
MVPDFEKGDALDMTHNITAVLGPPQVIASASASQYKRSTKALPADSCCCKK